MWFQMEVEDGPNFCGLLRISEQYGLTYLNVPNFYGLWLDVDIETFYHTGHKIVIFSSFLHALCPYDPSIGTVIQILNCTDRIKAVFPFLYAFAKDVCSNFFEVLSYNHINHI